MRRRPRRSPARAGARGPSPPCPAGSRPLRATALGWAAGCALLAAAAAPAMAQETPPVPVPPPEIHGEAARRAGFVPGAWVAQRELERRFLAVPRADSAMATAAWLARDPHPSGSAAAAALADSLARRLAALGFRVEVDSFQVWLPHPVSLRLELLDREAGAPRPLSVREPSPARGADEGPDWWLAWHAYAASGRAEGEVVYANYGRPEDYETLEERGVEVAGKVVLARFGHVYRGVKVREAQVRGAVGVVLYPDPGDDGYARGDTLPLGPYRPAAAVQRGTVSELSRYTGDPLTPGRPAYPGVPRLAPEEAPNLPGIPVLSLGYGEAVEVLRALEGPETPQAFRGALPVSYRAGPGPARLRMEVRLDARLRPIRNVIATLHARGAEQAAGREKAPPSRESPGAPAVPGRVILGNHYDAWLYGGTDPHGGTAVLLEVARGLSVLAADGWRPRREVVLAFWDAEEFGAVGSTEWVEARQEALRGRTAAYLNVDTYTAGILDVAGPASLRDLVVGAAEDVRDPESGRSLADLWHERQAGAQAEEDAEAGGELPRLGDLGAGSDWTAFFHHAGVPSLQFTMNGRGVFAVYHSALDDAEYLRRHADPGMAHAPALAGVMGIVALRLAEADALPHRYDAYAHWLDTRIDELDTRLRARGWLEEPLAPGGGAEARRERGPDVDGLEPSLAEARAAAARLREAADRLEAHRRDALQRRDRGALASVDRALLAAEGALLDERGVPGRPWYRHQALAADPETGYGPLPLPAAREGLRAEDPGGTARGLQRLAAAVRRAAAALEEPAPEAGSPADP